MSERYYVNAGLSPGSFVLEGAEAHHLVAVCRTRPGEQVFLFNGDGHEYPARVVAVERRQVILEVLEATRPKRELPFLLEVAVPLPKGDRAQFLVEKLTELGATSLVPLTTRRSVVHPREGRLEKLERCVIEASKQCGRNVLMRIAPLTAWTAYLRRADLSAVRLLAHPDPAEKPDFPDPRGNQSAPVVVAVGPEGGLTDEEVKEALAAHWRLVNLGPRTLRVETAALMMAAGVILAHPLS